MRPTVKLGATALAAAALCGVVAAAPASAGFEPPRAGPLDRGSVEEPFRDSVIEDGAATTSAAAKASRAARAPNDYLDLHGHSVTVEVSDRYAPDPAADQDLVDFLGTLAHGGEMSRLTVVVLTPGELSELCGAQALACYGSRNGRMFISGDGSQSGQAPLEFVVAHEYGHHVAAARDNSPWSAFEWGTKRWASYERVCPGVRAGDYHPGAQGQHYYSNPGEAFAEAFAEGHYPGLVRWDWDERLKPDDAALGAIFADVASPWRGPTTIERQGKLPAGGARTDVSEVDMPLDGRLTAELSAPGDADFDLYLTSAGGKDLARSTNRGSDERVRYTICGRRSVGVAAYRHKGGGRFATETLRP